MEVMSTHAKVVEDYANYIQSFLNLNVFQKLLEVAAEIQETQPVLLQYIVTTTTSPPKHLGKKPWLAETLCGSPADRRLLGVDPYPAYLNRNENHTKAIEQLQRMARFGRYSRSNT